MGLPVVALGLDVVVPTVRSRLPGGATATGLIRGAQEDGPPQAEAKPTARPRPACPDKATARVTPEPSATKARITASETGHAPWIADIAGRLPAVGAATAEGPLATPCFRRVA